MEMDIPVKHNKHKVGTFLSMTKIDYNRSAQDKFQAMFYFGCQPRELDIQNNCVIWQF